ncbi:PIM3 kinase, partial [Polypterus senegalus]|nr:PIM3 kinase [Polypterus senegalus]
MVEQMPLTESWPFVDMGEEEHHDQRWPVACKKALGQGRAIAIYFPDIDSGQKAMNVVEKQLTDNGVIGWHNWGWQPGEHNKVPLEIVLLQRACAKPSCKSVIQMFGCFFGCYRTFIVMELLDSTMSLQDFIKMGPMKKPRAERAFGQIVQAVLHSHSRGVFHNDLKAGNILYQTTTGQIKLGIDFAMET